MTDQQPTTRRGSTTVDRSFSALAPAVRRIAFDAVPPRDRSLPVALCLSAGAVAAATDDADATVRESDPRADDRLEPVTNAVAFLEGYVRIRARLLRATENEEGEVVAEDGEPNALADRRDAAVLASDYLHAAAYEPIAAAPIPDRRTLDLYRTLASGSSSLAGRFALSAGEPTADDTDGEGGAEAGVGTERPNATLAATAGALGATATGASSDARTALETYARSLSAALRTRSGALPEDASVDPRETAVRVLSGRVGDGETEDQRGGADGSAVDYREPSAAATVPDAVASPSAAPAIERNLERARDAVATLEDAVASTADRAPVARLERATRIPFRHEE